MLMSPPTSPTFTALHSYLGKLPTESENLPLSLKYKVELSSKLELDCHMHPCTQSARRTPLNPLSASDLENRRHSRDSHSTDTVSYHSLVTQSSSSDLRLLLPEQFVSSGYCTGMQRSGTPGALVCSWPPPIPIPGNTGSLVGPRKTPYCLVHSSDEKNLSRATSPEPTSTSKQPSDVSQTEPTMTMNMSIRATNWKSENVIQPSRSRTNSLPSVRRPPGELWWSDVSKEAYEPVDIADSMVYSTPPGLPSRRPELRRSNSVLDIPPHGSVSSSLALGSQPLRASEPTRAVPPIGAERSRVVSITSLKSRAQTPPPVRSDSPCRSPWHSASHSPGIQPKWSGEVCLSSTPSQAKQPISNHPNMARADLERIYHHTLQNKHTPKIISPLSPLRTATSIPAFDLSGDPAFRLRMPSQSNYPSLRYLRSPPRRARTLCDGFQSFDWDTTCVHCQECKRDTVGKRLLAFRYRQQLQQTRQHFQRNNNLKVPRGGATTPTTASPIAVGVDNDRIALASHIREAYAYEVDDDEKSLWEEVAAITGAAPLSFSVRASAPPCGTAAYRRSSANVGGDDVAPDDYLEVQEEGLLANESVTLFRDVSVY